MDKNQFGLYGGVRARTARVILICRCWLFV